jgi:methionine-rich copper-binding protein CopC
MLGMYAGKERRNRVVALVLAAVLVAGVVLALLATVVQAGPAQAAAPAHATLVSVTPADGAELASAPTQIQLTFDSGVSAQFVQIYLTRDGAQVETGPPSGSGTVITVPVTGQTGPGAYKLLWQVTGDDGHRVPGESSFSVTGGAAGAPVATPRVTPSYKTPQTQPTTIGHPDHLPGLITAGILLLGGLVLLVYEHRRRARAPEPDETDTQDRQRIS